MTWWMIKERKAARDYSEYGQQDFYSIVPISSSLGMTIQQAM